MGNCIEDMYDFDLIKKCRVCKNILSKAKFHKKQNLEMDYNLNVNFV